MIKSFLFANVFFFSTVVFFLSLILYLILNIFLSSLIISGIIFISSSFYLYKNKEMRESIMLIFFDDYEEDYPSKFDNINSDYSKKFHENLLYHPSYSFFNSNVHNND